MLKITLDKKPDQETLYNIKHGGYWLAERGLTSNRAYAKQYSKAEALAAKKHFDKNKYLVEIVERSNENEKM